MKKVLLLLLVSLTFSCSDRANATDDLVKQEAVEEEILKEDILQTSIDYDNLQWFYIDTTNLIILRNEIVTEPLILEKFGKPVVFLDSTELQNNAKAFYLVVKELIIKGDSAHVSLRYPSQGAGANLSLKRAANSWNVVRSEIFEN